MTADHTIQATPGQVAAIERDGFLVVAEPTEKPCPECGGRGTARYPIDNYAPVRCNECTGDGTVPIVVEVVVPERKCPKVGAHYYCECRNGTIPARTLLRGAAEAVPVVDGDRDDAREDPEWIEHGAHIETTPGVVLFWPESPGRQVVTIVFGEGWAQGYPKRVTHHFADVPRPEVGDTAWIIRGEG